MINAFITGITGIIFTPTTYQWSFYTDSNYWYQI